jgi:4-amino-4-deoxychorismate mutase
MSEGSARSSTDRQARSSTERPAAWSTGGLESFRRDLDRLDEEIARTLGERFETCREIALYKRAHGIPMMQPERVVEVRSRYLARGAEARLPPEFTSELFELLIGATCRLEDELIDAQAPASDRAPDSRSGPMLERGEP